jgi:hypothetical protein
MCVPAHTFLAESVLNEELFADRVGGHVGFKAV